MALKSWNRARKGNVTSSKFLRPNLSMVKKAGTANTKLMIPTPIDHYEICQCLIRSRSRAVGELEDLQEGLCSRDSELPGVRMTSSRLKRLFRKIVGKT